MTAEKAAAEESRAAAEATVAEREGTIAGLQEEVASLQEQLAAVQAQLGEWAVKYHGRAVQYLQDVHSVSPADISSLLCLNPSLLLHLPAFCRGDAAVR